MKKVVLIPDSFKGTMSSGEICAIMRRAVLAHYPAAQVVSVPVADGGEGSVDAFLCAVGGQRRTVRVAGPFFQEMESFYGVLDDGKTAVIEMAACAGLPLTEGRRNPLEATTYGVGQLIRHAVESGCRTVIMGLGGSATNDGGCGAAAAAGARFLGPDGKEFVPVGGTLKEICRIDLSHMLPQLAETDIITMCDIDNPLYGPSGAAHVFAPQKGADEKQVALLDDGLQHLDRVIQHCLGLHTAQLPGAGAAGGMGCGMAAFFHSRLQMGIETVLDTVHFDRLLSGADMVFTGEGKIDSQSARGKVVSGVALRTAAAGVPLIAVVGDIGDGAGALYEKGVSAIFSINRVAVPYEEARPRAKDDLYLTMDNLMRFFKRMEL